MSLPVEIASLMSNSDVNVEQKIVEELLNQNNLDTKTELSTPISWSCLKIIQEFLENKKLGACSNVLSQFIAIAFKYLISKDRKGRLEYLEALKGIQQREMNGGLPNSSMLVGGGVVK